MTDDSYGKATAQSPSASASAQRLFFFFSCNVGGVPGASLLPPSGSLVHHDQSYFSADKSHVILGPYNGALFAVAMVTRSVGVQLDDILLHVDKSSRKYKCSLGQVASVVSGGVSKFTIHHYVKLKNGKLRESSHNS